jgi:hypothetical protein
MAASQAGQPIQKTSIKNPKSSFSDSFIFIGKQGGGAIVLMEGHDIVTREISIPTSLNLT